MKRGKGWASSSSQQEAGLSFCATQVLWRETRGYSRITHPINDQSSTEKAALPAPSIFSVCKVTPLKATFYSKGLQKKGAGDNITSSSTFQQPVTIQTITPSDRPVWWQWILQSSLRPELRKAAVVLLKPSTQLKISPVFTTNPSQSSLLFYRLLTTKGISSIKKPLSFKKMNVPTSPRKQHPWSVCVPLDLL